MPTDTPDGTDDLVAPRYPASDCPVPRSCGVEDGHLQGGLGHPVADERLQQGVHGLGGDVRSRVGRGRATAGIRKRRSTAAAAAAYSELYSGHFHRHTLAPALHLHRCAGQRRPFRSPGPGPPPGPPPPRTTSRTARPAASGSSAVRLPSSSCRPLRDRARYHPDFANPVTRQPSSASRRPQHVPQRQAPAQRPGLVGPADRLDVGRDADQHATAATATDRGRHRPPALRQGRPTARPPHRRPAARPRPDRRTSPPDAGTADAARTTVSAEQVPDRPRPGRWAGRGWGRRPSVRRSRRSSVSGRAPSRVRLKNAFRAISGS